MAKVSVAEFIRQVRQEASKVTWSTHKDTIMSTVVVLVIVLFASTFFLLVDVLILNVVQTILGF